MLSVTLSTLAYALSASCPRPTPALLNRWASEDMIRAYVTRCQQWVKTAHGIQACLELSSHEELVLWGDIVYADDPLSVTVGQHGRDAYDSALSLYHGEGSPSAPTPA